MESSKLLSAIIVFLSGALLFATGIIDEDTVREFDYYSDTYRFSASAEVGWEILSAIADGGGSKHWIALPPATKDDGSKNYPRGSVSALGTRAEGTNSSNLFSATLSGSIRPVGSGDTPRTYSYSVKAAFKGELSIEPISQTAPLGGGVPESYRLLSTYDEVVHHIGGYWRTTPNRAGENSETDYTRRWSSYYGGETRWPGLLTVEGSAHSDGGDLKSAVLRVVGVSSVTATGAGNTSKTSSTDGIKRNAYQEAEKDSNGDNILEEIPTFFSKQAEAVTLSATPTPGTPWPVYSSENNQSYPIWSIPDIFNQSDYLTSTYGASSATKPEKGFGNFRVNASCGNQKSIFLKFIRVKFAKKNIYAGWNFHDEHNVSQYLAGKSSLMGCPNPSTCTDLQCNHHGIYDESHFSWSVSGDAELVLIQNNQTVYATSFSPAAEKDKPAETKKYFTGKIRFTKSSITTDNNIIVTATSEELASETDFLTIIPQYINLSATGAAEEEYTIDENGTTKLNNPRNAESTAGAFVPINDNDDNQDRNCDRNKTTETAGTDPDLIEITINKKIDGTIDEEHPVVLSLSHVHGGNCGIKVWSDANQSELLIDGSGNKNFTTADSIPNSVFVEAISSTSANLTISHSFAVNNDPATTNWFASSVSDLVLLEGFGVDIVVNGLQNEATVNDVSGNAVRTLVYEEFPGGEIDITPVSGWMTVKIDTEEQLRSIYLIPVTLMGNNLMRNTANMQLDQDETHPDFDREIIFTCSSDKVEFYKRVKNADGSDKVDSNNNPVYQRVTTITQTVADLPWTVYLRPLKDSDSKRDVELKLSYMSPQNEVTHEDVIKLTLLHLDVDVDSNNDGIVAVDDETEDETELYAPIEINSGDKDNDGITDNIDFEIAGVSNVFKEMKIRLPDSIDLDNCKIKINYGAATLPDANGNFTSDGSQSLRIWKKQSSQLRTVTDYIAPTVEDDPSTPDVNEETFYTPTELIGAGNREASLWVESVCEASGYNAKITVSIVPIIPKNITMSTVFPDDEASISETYNLSDTVGFSTLGITLKFPNPIPATPAAGETPASRGYDTILVANIADESEDARRPDYANFEERNDTSLLQLDMSISIGNLPKNNFKIKFEYDGIAQLDNLTEVQIPDSSLKDIFMRGNKLYYDYTPFKKGAMRVWASSKPVENAGTWSSTKVITASSERDREKYGISTGNYFSPSNSVDNAYLLSDLFPDSNGGTFAMNFWVEGINPYDKTPIKATLLYNNGNSWQEVAASFVNVRVLEAKVILNTNNDKDFLLDDEDHKIKDQHDGFQGWFAAPFNSDTLADATSTHGLENIFPILLKDLPKLPNNNMKYELRINHSGVLTENPASGNSRTAYITNQSYANTLKGTIAGATSSYSIETHETPKDLEFVFGIYQTGLTALNRVSLVLYPDKTNAPNVYYTLDNSLYIFRPVDKYFWMGSTRGTANVSYNYPTEDGRTVTDFQTYPDVTAVSGFADNYDSSKDILIFLHGFNVDTSAAYTWNRVMFRRLYWSGYRENYLGITWHGDDGAWAPAYFDTNVFHALQTSRSIRNFISSLPSDKVNVAAHSLGNLVMWDALRLHKVHSGGQLAKNVISIEGAVWEETFFSQASIAYTATTDPGHVITYTEDQLKRHSWAFWFNQTSHKATDAIDNFINSKTNADDSLLTMKTWSAASTRSKYDRDNTTAYRTPNSNSLPEIVALMKVYYRRPRISYETPDSYRNTLTDPIGITNALGADNCNANALGWRNTEHSDMKNREFYLIHSWFKEIFKNKTQIIK